MIVDIYVEDPGEGHRVYAIGRGGRITYVGHHYPWFALYLPRGSGRTVEMLKEAFQDRIVDIVPIDLIPLLPHPMGARYEARPSYQAYMVKATHRRVVKNLAEEVVSKVSPVGKAGLYNIVYPVRAAFDLDIKLFHPKCPIVFQPNEKLEALSMELIEGIKDLKIMAFDIEVASKGRFPRPGDPIISVAYGVVTLGDDDFFDPSWWRDNVAVFTAETRRDSFDLVQEFFRILSREQPDILVGYNSVNFDVPHMKAFLETPQLSFPDPHHVKTGGLVFPHVDLMEVRDSMGATLGLRSGRAYALVDVVREIAAGDERLSWLASSPLMEAEERMNHAKIEEEWRSGSRLFYTYTSADIYLTLILAKEWFYTLALLSALVQVPVTELSRLNTGQVAEYNMVHWLEKLGFGTVIAERDLEFRKTTPDDVARFSRTLGNEAHLFTKGKVYVKEPGVFSPVSEADFAQLYPTLMANETVDPLGFRVRMFERSDGPARLVRLSDPLFSGEWKVAGREFPVILGYRKSKSADVITMTYAARVVPTYGPIAFLIYKMFTMRRITKKLKKRAKKEGRPELAAPDQAVKILNNASFGAFSKRRGWIHTTLSAYVFWKTLKILYDVIGEAERSGVKVVYSDTDSIFAEMGKEEFAEILRRLNEYVKKRYGVEFELEFEDAFDECIIPKHKKGTAPSAKSYICLKDGKVAVFKGEFFKATMPEGVKEKLADFYEALITKQITDEKRAEQEFKRILEGLPIHKLFVRKTVDTFQSTAKPAEGFVNRLKTLNKSFHFAALHQAYVWNLPGVSTVSKRKYGDTVHVTYRVDVSRVLEAGVLIPYYLPGNNPKQFTLYVEDDGQRVHVHLVRVRAVSVFKERAGDGRFVEKGYTVSVTYVDRWMSKEELVSQVVGAMRKHVLDSVATKLIPVLRKKYGGPLERFLFPSTRS